ncbi:hypothetical protein [Pseudomonas sp. P9(2020)]|uniref:hypothetical protein n=1 Tax=Pseudomonas sp. P9(2020) TaxID=2763316 RepID=UPI001B334AFC|nr:hypothetical protein [Pseudomonas sp. P9(2020)]MBP5947888.1 hypothetical protein [Pseudomonas sp. P9(2020)]
MFATTSEDFAWPPRNQVLGCSFGVFGLQVITGHSFDVMDAKSGMAILPKPAEGGQSGSDFSLPVVTVDLEQPIRGDIALVARTIRRRWTIKIFMARIAQRVANTGRRVASGRWLLRTTAIAVKTKRFHRHRSFPTRLLMGG